MTRFSLYFYPAEPLARNNEATGSKPNQMKVSGVEKGGMLSGVGGREREREMVSLIEGLGCK